MAHARRIVGGAAAVALAAVAGCDGDVKITSFEADETLPAMTVPGSPLGGLLTGGPSPVAADIQSQAEFQQENFDYVRDIVIKSLTLTITAASTSTTSDPGEDGNPDTFDFVDSVDLYVEATQDGQTVRERVAFLPAGDPQLSAGASTLTLQMTGVNVLPFVEAAGGYTIRLEATGSIPPDDVIFDGVVVYRVTVSTKR